MADDDAIPEFVPEYNTERIPDKNLESYVCAVLQNSDRDKKVSFHVLGVVTDEDRKDLGMYGLDNEENFLKLAGDRAKKIASDIMYIAESQGYKNLEVNIEEMSPEEFRAQYSKRVSLGRNKEVLVASDYSHDDDANSDIEDLVADMLKLSFLIDFDNSYEAQRTVSTEGPAEDAVLSSALVGEAPSDEDILNEMIRNPTRGEEKE